MKTKTILIALFLSISIISFSQKIKSKPMNISIGKKAIAAWEKGEKSGNYTDFKALLSGNFKLFSHPLMGKFENGNAKEKMLGLITDREKVSNNLTFSNMAITSSENKVCVQFNSKGMVQGGKFPYEGFNIIVFQIVNKKITGFQEYFGYVDPNWFK